MDGTRVVLVKPDDVLVFGNVGPLTPDQAELLAAALRDEVGVRTVVFFAADIDLAAVPAATESSGSAPPGGQGQ